MSDFNTILGKRIRYLREDLGYSREKLAELAEMNDKFLYEVETGRKGISAYKMYNLSIALNVTMDFLVNNKQNNDDYIIIISLLNSLNRSEIKNVEEIIRKIVESLSNYRK